MKHRGGRKSIKGVSAKKKQFKRVQYSYELKHEVIQRYADGWSIDTISSILLDGKKASIVRNLVSRWRKEETFIALMASNASTAARLRHRNMGTATTLSFTAERELVRWINALRADGVPVSAKMLALHALDVAEADGIPPGMFSASSTWMSSFLRRNRLSFRARNRAGQSSPDEGHAVSKAFADEVQAWMLEHRTSRVYNADQTAVFFEMLPKKTVSARGEQVVWVKCGKREKQRATAMLLADSDGNKYEPFIVLKNLGSKIPVKQEANLRARHGFSSEMWPEVQDIQRATGAQVYGNPTAWWNADLTISWMDYFFGDRGPDSEPVLLLLDSFSGHWTDEVQVHAVKLNVALKSVPPSMTWRCQPADVAWMKPLKDGLRTKWVDFLRQQLAQHARRGGRFVMRPPDRGDVIEWVTDGWNNLTDRTIIRGFSKCGYRDPPEPSTAENTEGEILDASAVVEELQSLGCLDNTIGEVYDSMDVVDLSGDVTEVVV